jgi:hypothetical protein
VTARWTWAIEGGADRLGIEDGEGKRSSGPSSACSIDALICTNGAGGNASWSRAQIFSAASPTESGRGGKRLAKLIAAGPDRLERGRVSRAPRARAPERAIA